MGLSVIDQTHVGHTPNIFGVGCAPQYSCGSGFRTWAQHVWFQIARLDSFLLFNEPGHFVQAQHSLENFSGPCANPLLFYTNLISNFFSRIQLKMSQGWDYTSATPLHKRTRLIHYKYTMNSSSQMFIISLFLIFLESIFLKYHHTLRSYCFYYQRVHVH